MAALFSVKNVNNFKSEFLFISFEKYVSIKKTAGKLFGKKNHQQI